MSGLDLSAIRIAVDEVLQKHVAARAIEIDQNADVLREALSALCAANGMALRRPNAYGGPEMPEQEFRQFQEQSARASGTFSFLMTQHQTAVSMLTKCKNEALKTEYLPKMANGEKLVGIGFSQLRRPGDPIFRATPVSGGYVFEGHVPWITGWTFYPEFLGGAALPDGQAVFAILPFSAQEAKGGKITLSEPMRLAAMETALTVTADFENWFVPEDRIVFIQPANWAKNNDLVNIVLQGHFAIGCALAGLDTLKLAAEKKSNPAILDAHQALSEELESLREKTREVERGETEMTTDEKYALRAWAIELAVRCAHAAVVASGGAANSVQHHAQRIYREALVFSVSAQTEPIQRATLERLIRRNGKDDV